MVTLLVKGFIKLVGLLNKFVLDKLHIVGNCKFSEKIAKWSPKMTISKLFVPLAKFQHNTRPVDAGK